MSLYLFASYLTVVNGKYIAYFNAVIYFVFVNFPRLAHERSEVFTYCFLASEISKFVLNSYLGSYCFYSVYSWELLSM